MSDEDEIDYEALRAKFDEWLRRPLPDGLAVLSLELESLQFGRGYEKINAFGPSEDMYEVLGDVGHTMTCFPGKKTCFGTFLEKGSKNWRGRLDVIGPRGLLTTFPAIQGSHKVTHSKIFDDLSHLARDSEDHRDCECVKFGPNAYLPDFHNRDFGSFIQAAKVDGQKFARMVDVLAVAAGDIANAAAMLRRSVKKPRSNTFLVPGLIPDGAPTLLLGNRKAGKSTALLELAVAVARREPQWMGFPLNHERRGLAIYLSGEDSEAEVIERVRRMTGGETPYGLHVIPARGGDLDEIVENMQKENPRLFVVDPARKYFKGDEDGSDATSDLFNRIEPLIQSKNCAAIVSHHLKRGANPRTVADVADYVRGSGVWIDRPRVTLGMLRSGDETLFGISGPPEAPLHNFRRDTMFAGVRRLRRDDPTSRHIPSDRPHAAAEAAPATDELASVMAAAKGLLDRGERITRTGPKELFKHQPPEIAGWPRAKVRAAAKELIGTGQLVLTAEGSLSIAAQAEAPLVADQSVRGVDSGEQPLLPAFIE